MATIDLTKFSLCLRFAPLVLSLADSDNLSELWSMELSSTLMKSWKRLRRWSSVTNCWQIDYHTNLFITNCKDKIKCGTQEQTKTKKQRALQWRVFDLKKLKDWYSQEHQTVTSIIESIKEKAIMAVNWVWQSLKGANNGITLETSDAFSWKRITLFNSKWKHQLTAKLLYVNIYRTCMIWSLWSNIWFWLKTASWNKTRRIKVL